MSPQPSCLGTWHGDSINVHLLEEIQGLQGLRHLSCGHVLPLPPAREQIQNEEVGVGPESWVGRRSEMRAGGRRAERRGQMRVTGPGPQRSDAWTDGRVPEGISSSIMEAEKALVIADQQVPGVEENVPRPEDVIEQLPLGQLWLPSVAQEWRLLGHWGHQQPWLTWQSSWGQR